MDKNWTPPQRNAVGHDSEFFIWDTQKQEVVSSHLFYPEKQGAKKDKMRGALVFRDGLAVEINTPPEYCVAYILDAVRFTLLDQMAKHEFADQRYVFTSRPWVKVSKELLSTFPEDMLRLGCSPTLDAYKMRRNEITVDPKKLRFRTSGSHLHMSLMKRFEDPEHAAVFIRLADILLGVPFVNLFHEEDEFKRRKLYGRAGEFRLQEYPNGQHGIEYRVLSSRLWDHPAVASLFFQIWRHVLGMPATLKPMLDLYDPAWDNTVQEAINEDSPAARKEALEFTKKLLATRVKSPYAPVQFDLDTHLPLFQTKKEAGWFSDAGLISNKWPEMHTGFSEYALSWQKGKELPK